MVYFIGMEIKTPEDLKKAKEKLRELQALLSHTEPGKYPEKERDCIDLFDSLELYYTKGGLDT